MNTLVNDGINFEEKITIPKFELFMILKENQTLRNKVIKILIFLF